MKVLVEGGGGPCMQGFVPYTPSAFRILPEGGAAGGGGGGPCMQGFVSYKPPPLFEFCQEKLTVMQVGIENVTSTGNF